MSVHPNANFYGLNTSSIGSAVHVPTPLYDRNPKLLKAIEWSDIDSVYRTNREEIRDLAFQMFCSANGFMRYFPAATWFWDNADEGLDLFDCRNTEWYINAATNSKNMLIMLDMSGSMLGQRYEIAKQTTEAILETLSHNDYFNIMQVGALIFITIHSFNEYENYVCSSRKMRQLWTHAMGLRAFCRPP